MRRKIITAFCAALVLTSAASPAFADNRWNERGDGVRWQQADHGKHGGKHHKQRKHAKNKHRGHGKTVVVWHGQRHWNPPPRRVVHHHHYRPRPVHRHDTHYRYRQQRDDWAVYAILALQLVEVLNSQQQQRYAWATQEAAVAPLGDRIQWQDSGAYGSVTPVRDGTDGGGRYCREFQHQIIVGNRQQSGYGIACRQPDGAWEIVS